MSNWQIKGLYFETCNCDYICPCIASNLTAKPTEGDCKAALVFDIAHGEKNGVGLGGVAFIVLMHSPGPMADGNITVGLIVDEGASKEQVEQVAPTPRSPPIMREITNRNMPARTGKCSHHGLIITESAFLHRLFSQI
jgi:hypothetical protein